MTVFAGAAHGYHPGDGHGRHRVAGSKLRGAVSLERGRPPVRSVGGAAVEGGTLRLGQVAERGGWMLRTVAAEPAEQVVQRRRGAEIGVVAGVHAFVSLPGAFGTLAWPVPWATLAVDCRGDSPRRPRCREIHGDGRHSLGAVWGGQSGRKIARSPFLVCRAPAAAPQARSESPSRRPVPPCAPSLKDGKATRQVSYPGNA